MASDLINRLVNVSNRAQAQSPRPAATPATNTTDLSPFALVLQRQLNSNGVAPAQQLNEEEGEPKLQVEDDDDDE